MSINTFGWNGTNGDAWSPIWTTSFYGPTGTIDIQSNKGRLITGSTGGYACAARARLNYSVNDVDILAKITPGQAWATEAFISLGLGDVPSVGDDWLNGWRVVTTASGGVKMEMWHEIAGVRTSIDSTTTNFYTGSNTMWFRFRKSGNIISGKVWDEGSVEPNWGLLLVDTTGPTSPAMFPGILVNNGNAASSVSFTIESLVINNLTPVRQRSNFRRI